MSPTVLKVILGLAALAPSVSATYDQPECSSFPEWTYKGCYVDSTSDRTFPVRPGNGKPYEDMTVADCTAMCKGNGFRYAGLEYYGECFCGTTISSDTAPESACSFPCNGKKNDKCGGMDALSVWEDPTYGEAQVGGSEDYSYAGCITDLDDGRILAHSPDDYDVKDGSVDSCLDACGALGYGYAGLEYYGECYCGSALEYASTPADESECSYPCSGNASEICGGSARMSLWTFPDLISSAPCDFDDEPDTPDSSSPVVPSSTPKPTPSSNTPAPPFSSSSAVKPPPFSSSSGTPKPAFSTSTPKPASSKPVPPPPPPPPPASSVKSSSAKPSSASPTPVKPSSSPAKTSSFKTSTSAKLPSNSYTPPPYTPTQTTKKPTPAPTPSCVCKVAAPWAGNKCVGSITLPCVGCNDKISERTNWPFKLFNHKDYSKCPRYSPSQPKNACYDACKTQYDWCINYANECKRNKGKPGYEDGDAAQKKCVQQYNDCYKVNGAVSNQGQCPAKQGSSGLSSDGWLGWLAGWIKGWDWN